MSDKKMTAEEIYYGIRSDSMTGEMGIKLIENYGIQKQKEFINKLQEEYPGYSGEIEVLITEMNNKLDTMLNNIVEAAKK